MKSLGIDIGSHSIKVVELTANNKGHFISQYFEHRLDLNPNKDNDLNILEFLRDLSKKYDPTQTIYNFALPQEQVALRFKTFPFSDRNKINKSLNFELEDEIPFADHALFEAKMVRINPPTSDVLACAVMKDHVANVIKRATDSNMEPHVVSAQGFAFANLKEKWDQPIPINNMQNADFAALNEKSIEIVIHFGFQKSLVSAYDQGRLVGVRTILWGAKMVAEAIQKKYEIPFSEALKELENKGFVLLNKKNASFDQVTFSDTISKSIRDMARDLNLVLLDLKSEFDAQIANVEISGGLSLVQNVGAFLTQLIELPVNRFEYIQNFQTMGLQFQPQQIARMGVALGLAFEGLKKPRNPAVNFLKEEFARQNQALQLFWKQWGHACQIGLAAIVFFFVYSYLREDFALKLSDRTVEVMKDQAKSVAKIPEKKANEKNIKKYILENKKRAADLKNLASIAKMNSGLDILKKLTDTAPIKTQIQLELRNFTLADTQLSIEGYVANDNELKLLQSHLKNMSITGQVNNSRVNLPTIPGKVSFSYNFTVDREIEKAKK